MVTETVLNLIFSLISSFIDILPQSFFELPDWYFSFRWIVARGMSLLPDGIFGVFIANVIFWLVTQYGWAIVEWVYKKIPGVD